MTTQNGSAQVTRETEAPLASALRQASTPTSDARFKRVRFDNKAAPVYLPELRRDRNLIEPALRRQIESLLNGIAPWPLFVHGTAGTGKTRAALSVLDAAQGCYWELPELCAEVRRLRTGAVYYDGPHGGLKSERDIWAVWQGSPVTVLDEIGTRERASDFQYEVLKKAIDVREEDAAIFISNIDLESVAEVYDDRIASRLSAGTVVKLDGEDRRLVQTPF